MIFLQRHCPPEPQLLLTRMVVAKRLRRSGLGTRCVRAALQKHLKDGERCILMTQVAYFPVIALLRLKFDLLLIFNGPLLWTWCRCSREQTVVKVG